MTKYRHRSYDFEQYHISDANIFTALGSEFIVPGTSFEEIKNVEDEPPPIKEQFTIQGIRKFWKNFWSRLWQRIWIFYVEALYIPSYREEWGRYKTWNYAYGERPKKKETISPTCSDSSLSRIDSERKLARKRVFNRILQRRKFLKEELGKVFHDGCEIIKINVSGTIYETQLRTLGEFPDTLLGNSEKRLRYWDPTRNEYFFDRHRKSFEAILYYYQTGGTLIRPQDISLSVFEDEIEFYQLGKSVLNRFLREEGVMNTDDYPKPVPYNLLQRKLWFLMEYPESSKQGRVVALFSVFVVIFSTVIFCVETLPLFSASETNKSRIRDPFFLCETTCVIWFTMELFFRLISCPSKLTFIQQPLNLIDFLSILPFYLTFFTVAEDEEIDRNTDRRPHASTSLVMLRIFRLFRVFRIFKLSRHSAGLQILGKTLRASLSELGLLMFFLIIGVIIFSSLVYFAEISIDSTEFSSIPDAFWWGVVTMTTLGYGDKVPKGTPGRLVSSLCAVAAVLTLALPIPIFVANFNYFYQRESQQEGRKGYLKKTHIQGCSHLPACPVNNIVNETDDDSNMGDTKVDGDVTIEEPYYQPNSELEANLYSTASVNDDQQPSSDSEQGSNMGDTKVDSDVKIEEPYYQPNSELEANLYPTARVNNDQQPSSDSEQGSSN